MYCGVQVYGDFISKIYGVTWQDNCQKKKKQQQKNVINKRK